MGTIIAASLFTSIAIVAAWFIRPRFADSPATMRACLFWLISSPLLFLIYPLMGELLLCAILLIALTPKDMDARAAFYILALFAIPSPVQAPVPFPGINYLVVLNFPMIACFALLAPTLAFPRAPVAARYAPVTGVLVILLTLLVAAQEFRAENLTNGLRFALDDFILYALPFMAILRLSQERAATENVISAFLTLGLIMACLAFISEAVDWNFYTFITERHGMAALADFRQGILRVSATVIPILVGFVATLGLIAVDYYRDEKKGSMVMAWFYRAILAVAIIFTFARGAWLAAMVAWFTYFFFTKFPRGVRPIAIAVGLFVVLPAAIAFVLNADLGRYDPYGTFEYRRELLNASVVQFKQHPIFGEPHYRDSGNFEHLYQGQGIIDIVNHYVHILLKHGAVGFALYIGAFVSVILALLSLGKIVRRDDNKTLERQRAFLLAAIISYLAMIATVSGVSVIQETGVFLIAVATAFVAAARKESMEAALTTSGGDGGETPDTEAEKEETSSEFTKTAPHRPFRPGAPYSNPSAPNSGAPGDTMGDLFG